MAVSSAAGGAGTAGRWLDGPAAPGWANGGGLDGPAAPGSANGGTPACGRADKGRSGCCGRNQGSAGWVGGVQPSAVPGDGDHCLPPAPRGLPDPPEAAAIPGDCGHCFAPTASGPSESAGETGGMMGGGETGRVGAIGRGGAIGRDNGEAGADLSRAALISLIRGSRFS